MQGDFFLTQWVFLGMRWLFENLTGESIALTVIISTLLIRALTVIGDIKSRQSSMKMQAIQPQLDKIRKKYENDPQRLNAEQSKLMKANNVSMFGGCLPMLFTLPLFFVFIAAFRQWGNEMMARLIVTLQDNEAEGLQMFENFKFLWINNIWMPDNGMSPVISQASTFLASANDLPKLLYFQENPAAMQLFQSLGFFVKNADGTVALAELTAEVTSKYNEIVAPCVNYYAGFNNGWFILPLLCGGTTFLSTWLMQRGQKQSEAAGNTNKLMQWLMPVMTFVFCLSNNAAFALYWTVSNVASMVTTFFINRGFAKKAAELEEGSKA